MTHNYSLDSETTTQSEFSPGIVENSELLLRLLFEPEHIVDNLVINTAISIEDLKSRGLSLDRIKFANKSLINKRIVNQQIKNRKNRKTHCLASFDCKSVREIKNDNQVRELILIDDAIEENIAHASIYANAHGKATLRKIRIKLIKLFKNRYSIENVFN